MATDYHRETNGMMPPFDFVLSGPIGGTEDAGARFALAYAEIRQEHFKATGKLPNVWNPAMLPEGRTNEWYMRRCLDAIFDSPGCVIVQMLGWERSKGARCEAALGESLGRSSLVH